MRASTWFLTLIAGWGGFVPTVGGATPDASHAKTAADPNALAVTLRAALEQELAGNDADRNRLLQRIVAQDPDFAPARWHLGDLQVNDDEWVPYRRFVDDQDERWHQLYLYRNSREERDDTIEDHFLLANGARERGMWDEERAHLTRIVELDWDNAEARRRLGDAKSDGFWVAREEVDAFARRLVQTRHDLDEWSPEVNRIVRRLFRSRQAAWEIAWQDLAAIRDPAAIPAVERALSEGDEHAAEWYLDWLSGLEAWEASVALARQAVLSPSAAIRVRAQQFLQERRIDDYAPVLLGAMRAGVDLRSRRFVNEFGALVYVERIAYETPGEVRVRNLAVLYGPENTSFNSRGAIGDSELPPGRIPQVQRAVLSHLRNHYHAFDARHGRAVQTATEIANDRASRAIAAAIQIPERSSPRDWWDWWNDYQQVYVSGPKRQVEENYEEIWTTDRQQIRRTPQRVVFIRPPPSPCSCFAAGTPVLTEYGPKPIEEILLGDRVLAQDIDTGQIAFKPVFTTTFRPPSRMLKITTEDSEFLCTGGHPFWINNLGWRYAWELEPGMLFHSVDGSSEIISVEDSGRKEKAYNLVVADFHDYFVGEGRILCHDNSPRNPTNALVPGLMPDWSSPAEPGP